MKYTISIDQVHAQEWGLSFSEAAVFSFCNELSTWADPIVIDGQVWYFASRNKVIEELSWITDRPDTVYRIYKALNEKGVIRWQKQGEKDCVQITAKGKQWNSEKFPRAGKKSEGTRKNFRINSEKNPTDKYTSDKYTSDKVVLEWAAQILADEMFLETVRRMHKMKNEDVAAALDSFLLQKRGLGEANWPTYSQFRKNFLFWIPKAKNNAPNRRADVSRTPPTVWNTDNARQAFLELCAEDGIDVSEAMRAFAAGGGGGD